MKEYYFYYNIALTEYLLDKKDTEDTAAGYLKKADHLPIDSDSKSKVKGIVNFDIETLLKSNSTRPEIINMGIEFQNKFVLPQIQLGSGMLPA
jgi:hypothetical protein